MDKSIFISVIIPCYNVEKYIERTVDSLDKQTYKNFEVIAINDGSTDNTQAFLEHLCGERPNYQVHSYENAGLSEARNRGMKFANGDYLYFLDADDLFLPSMFEDIVKLIKDNNNPDVAVFDFAFVWNQNKLPAFNNKPIGGECYSGQELIDKYVMESIGFSDKDLYDYYKTGFWVWKSTPTVWRHFYKRDFLNKNNIRFIKGLQLVEDIIFNLTVMAFAKSVVETQNKYYYYIQHEGLLQRINKNPRQLVIDKVNALKQRGMICDLYNKLHKVDLKNSYAGTNVLSCFQIAVALAELPLLESIKLYKSYLANKTIKEHLQLVSTKGAPVKIKVPLTLLKLKMPTVLLLLMRVAKMCGVKASI